MGGWNWETVSWCHHDNDGSWQLAAESPTVGELCCSHSKGTHNFVTVQCLQNVNYLTFWRDKTDNGWYPNTKDKHWAWEWYWQQTNSYQSTDNSSSTNYQDPFWHCRLGSDRLRWPYGIHSWEWAHCISCTDHLLRTKPFVRCILL